MFWVVVGDAYTHTYTWNTYTETYTTHAYTFSTYIDINTYTYTCSTYTETHTHTLTHALYTEKYIHTLKTNMETNTAHIVGHQSIYLMIYSYSFPLKERYHTVSLYCI